LAPNAPGYGDPKKPKYVVHFWARAATEGEPTQPQPNISMNQMFVGIDVRIAPGNPGAVAIRHRAAQGSSVQDSRIDATGGLTGLEGGAGSGGGHHGITVIGGRYGLDLRETQPAPTISGVTLTGQTEAAILCGSRQALAAVGVKIVSKAKGPLIRCVGVPWCPHNGQMCLVDSEILCEHPETTVIQAERSVYLNNVYVKGAAAVVAGPDGPRLVGNPDGWLHVVESAHRIRPPAWKKLQYDAPVYLDGVRQTEDVVRVVVGAAPPGDLVTRHAWPRDGPHFQSKGAVNVRAPPYGARGDGRHDDTAAIQRAIDENEIVFLPKGYYRLSQTLRLGPKTRLVGVGQHLSLLFTGKAEGDFADAKRPRPIVGTVDDAAAETVMAFCGVLCPSHVPGAYAVEWRAGRRSVVRSCLFMRRSLHGFSRPPEGAGSQPPVTSTVQIRGHGGGRWYNFEGAARTPQVDDYRHLLVEGTEPLHVYQLNVEYARSNAEMEIRGARHVSIYGLKGEYNEPILWIRDSDHVRVFGYGGNAAAFPGKSLFLVERTPNLLLANVVDHPRLSGSGSPNESSGVGVDPGKWHMIVEHPPGGADTIRTRPMDRPVLYKRGEPKAE
ncbi:MAG TPA: glycosyl hydrolase family 28-related protein, partial [Phycisphaerae bacterium]|nr:glycosyl hydrolase family 28-related protein [Phycisphaerae bacterium]